MSVSEALENSARAFNMKYSCKFDFATFESRVEEFTFLRPNNGWRDVYKLVFERMYKNALESAAMGKNDNLDGEAMLDDFEYTLIRPYVNESEEEIKHRPYAGMDRIARLEYLDGLTKEAPRNPVELYTEKYKNGELTLKQMKSARDVNGTEREYYVALAGYAEAIETVNQNRSFVWRAFHPFKNSAEKRDSALMKEMLVDDTKGGEAFYKRIVEAAYETFDGHKKANANLVQSMAYAKEEMNRKQKMKDAMRESLHIEGFDKENGVLISPCVDQHKAFVNEKQNLKQ